MEAHLIALAALVASVGGYGWWLHHLVGKPSVSGDAWYMRQFAYTDNPVSAPYCWRPLVPWLARWFGFKPVSLAATAITPFIIYAFVGGGWPGFCVAAMFVMNPHIFQFNIKNTDYCDSVGHCILAASVMAMYAGHWSAFPLFLLAALTRETLTAALGVVAVFINPWLLIPLAVGSLVALRARAESTDNRHPLTEDTYYGTVKRWAGVKGWKSINFAHTMLPLRGLALAMPFVWERVGREAQYGAIALAAIWLLALPASGQSRIVCYGFIFLAPFVAAISQPLLGAVTILVCFWPIDWSTYDERGDEKFAFVSG